MNKKLIITCEAKNNEAYICIDGEITSWQNKAKEFKEAVEALVKQGITNASVYINTYGGDCFEAAEIANVIKSFKGTITAELGAVCASSGTYIASKCSYVKAARNLSYMIHKPMGTFMGNSAQIAADLKLLTNMQDEYCKTYCEKTGLPESKIESMWQEDYWMNATEAKTLGFIDEILGQDAAITEQAVAALKAYKNAPRIVATALNQPQQQPNQQYMKNKLLIALATVPGFNLNENSSDAEYLAFVEGIKAKAQIADQLKTELEALKEEASSSKRAAVIAAAKAKKQITEAQVPYYEKALKADFESTKIHIEGLPVPQALSTVIAPAQNNELRANWTYADYQEKDPAALGAMAKNDLNKFKALFKNHYGYDMPEESK